MALLTPPQAPQLRGDTWQDAIELAIEREAAYLACVAQLDAIGNWVDGVTDPMP